MVCLFRSYGNRFEHETGHGTQLVLLLLRLLLSYRLSFFLSFFPPQCGAADAEIKVPSGENTDLNVLPLKHGVGQYIAIHATRTARDFSSLLISTLPVRSPAFYPKPLPIFSVLAVANTWFLWRPAE